MDHSNRCYPRDQGTRKTETDILNCYSKAQTEYNSCLKQLPNIILSREALYASPYKKEIKDEGSQRTKNGKAVYFWIPL